MKHQCRIVFALKKYQAVSLNLADNQTVWLVTDGPATSI